MNFKYKILDEDGKVITMYRNSVSPEPCKWLPLIINEDIPEKSDGAKAYRNIIVVVRKGFETGGKVYFRRCRIV